MLALFAAQQSAAAASGLAGGLLPAISASTLDGFAIGMLLSGGVFLLVSAHVQSPRRLGLAGTAQDAGELTGEPAGDAGSGHAGRELGDYPLPAPAVAAEAVLVTAPAAATPGTAPATAASAAATPATVISATEPGADSPAGAPAEVAAAPAVAIPAIPPAVAPAAVAEAAVLTVPGSSAAGDLLTGADADDQPEPAAPDEVAQPDDERGTRRAAGYQSRHRLSGAEEPRPWPAADGRRHAPRHAASTSASLARRVAALVPVRMAAASHRAA
jgi:hypothetical protein